MELVKRARHMAVGLVTTTEIQDAMPAAMFAHTRRGSEYLTIMDQYLHPSPSADVIMGGVAASLLPQSTASSRRKDNRDLFKEFATKGYHVITTRAEPQAAGAPAKLPGLFHMVEGGLMDKQVHPLDWPRAVWDTIELDKAVGVAKKWAVAHWDNTLIIVVADHVHSLSITGTYWEGDGKKGREAVRVYGETTFLDYDDADGDGFPEQVDVSRSLAIHWANHLDYYEHDKVLQEPFAPTVKEGEKWVANKQCAEDGALQTGNLPSSENNAVHTVEGVPLTASGPGAEQFHTTMDNTEVFFAIVNALGLDARQGTSPFVATR